MTHRPRRAALGLLLVLVAYLSTACGYSFHGNLPSHIKTVAVPIFKNQSDVPGLENAITSAVISAFSSGGRLRVVPVDQADSVLEG